MIYYSSTEYFIQQFDTISIIIDYLKNDRQIPFFTHEDLTHLHIKYVEINDISLSAAIITCAYKLSKLGIDALEELKKLILSEHLSELYVIRTIFDVLYSYKLSDVNKRIDLLRAKYGHLLS